ncbi:sodium channel and clathrin linker 1-like isoform X2 [Haemaphysalis longicornis]
MNARLRSREASLRAYEPFLKEYDALLRSIQAEILHFQTAIRALKKEAINLIARNRSLHRDLRRQVELNLSSDQSQSNQLLKDLQYQLDAVLEDKNITSKMLQTALQEIDRLENELEDKKDFVDRNTFEQSIEKVKVDYEKRYDETCCELERTKNELFEAQKNLQNAKLRLARYSEPVCVIENQLQEKEKKLDEVLQLLQQTQERLILAEEESTSAVARLAAFEMKFNKLGKEHTDNLRDLESCKGQSHALQEQLSTALEHAQESVSLAEKALLERQEAELKWELLERETGDLRASLDSLVEEAAQHTAREVEKFREKGNQHIRKLVKEIGQLQQALQEQQALVARLSEDNSGLRAELGRLQKLQAELRVNRDPAFQALSHTLTQAERMCQKHRLTAESLQDELVQQAKQSTFKVKQGELENQRLQCLVQDTERRLEELQSSKAELEEQLTELRHRVHAAEAECIALRKRHHSEVAMLKEALGQEKLLYSTKLQQMEDMFEKKLMNTQALLQAQQIVTEKWKMEASKMASEFETELLAARKKMSALKKTNLCLHRKAAEAAKEVHKKKRGDAYHARLRGRTGQVKKSAPALQDHPASA